MNKQSYRTILRSSAIMATAQGSSIAANLIKMKVLALLLGPVGVGLAGLYVSLITTASTIAGLGLGTAGTRRVAAIDVAENDAAFQLARVTLLWAGLALAAIGAATFWFTSGWIALQTLGKAARTSDIAWLAIGVGLTVAAGAQTALLAGLRRIGDLARIQAGAGIAGAFLGIIAVWLWDEQGLVAMALVVPFMTFLLGHVYAARTPRSTAPRPTLRAMLGEFSAVGALGLTIMLSQVATLASQLVVRVLVQRELGTDALGHFQAAWTISVTYVGFVLAAMGTDYFPRLSAALAEPGKANRLVNEQTEVALLLCGPVLVAMLGLAPWIVPLLYSDAFGPTVDVLRWQILGDVFKVISWPLGFVLLAAGAGKTFVMAEVAGVSVFILGVHFGLPIIGLSATGVAFVAMYVLYLTLVVAICAWRFEVVWNRTVLIHAACLFAGAVGIVLVADASEIAGGAIGFVAACLLGLWSMLRISRFSEDGASVGWIGRISQQVAAWISR
jgi:PST family polysaccharide transporter